MDQNRQKQLREVEKIAKEANDPTLLKSVANRMKDKPVRKDE